MAGGQAARGRPTAEIAAGTLAGVRGADGDEFLGVPYGRAERFAPPLPVDGWDGALDATRYGLAAPQPNRPAARFTHGPMPPTGEDCLNLNVFAPSLEGRRPVIVWLHGGGFAIGHSGASLYHGGGLAAAADAVVVTVNYRLGSLGWLCHPALRGGNWGLLDQIAALRWVRENIGAFGGDPDRVTVAGQSAGALCAIDLLAAPAARGLFRRVILQSPPLGDLIQAPEVAQRWADSLAAAGGDLGLLRSLPADRVVALHEALLERPEWRGTRGGALPTLDPGSLPTSALEVPGVSPEVDVLAGHTADEGTFFFDSPWRPPPPPERVPDIVAHLCPDEDPGEVLRRYGGELVAVATEAMVAGPLDSWCQARAATGARVYRYRFDHPGGGARLRATHTAEVPLLFGTWRDGDAGERLGGQQIGAHPPDGVADALVAAWRSFVHGSGPGWRPLTGGEAPPEVGVFGGRRPYYMESRPEAVTQA